MENIKEIWRNIEGYENLYKISNLGRVKSLKFGKEKILKSTKNKYGYLIVDLCKEGKSKTFKVHRLVATTFIPNPENKPEIDHINTDRTDNRVENLKWVTPKENRNNPLTLENMRVANIGNKNPMFGKCGKQNHRSKPILQLTPYGDLIKKWDSGTQIKKELGFDNSNICMCCNGKRKSAYGYVWGYADDYEKIKFNIFDLEIYEKKVA